MECNPRPETFTKPFGFRSIAVAALLSCLPAFPQTQIAPGDESLRHHLQLLVEAKEVDTLVTSWPLSGKEISARLDSLSEDELSAPAAQSLRILKQRLNRSQSDAATLMYGNRKQTLRGFSDDFRERGEIRYQTSETFGPLSLHLQAAVVDDPLDRKNARLDGSYLTLDAGNWRLGAGRVDRWWGPGWQSSLILSNNARPSPGIFLDRATTRPFDIPLLRKLGPWSFNAFANQLEGERHIRHAKLLGGRFTFKPLPALEIGLSRTAQWGGDGRPETLETLADLVLGNDNVGSDGLDLDGSNEPGNQLGAIDLSWTTRINEHPITFYGQLVGEDEAGGLPSRKIGLFGIESPLETSWSQGRLYLEASDTTMDFLDDRFANSAYNHHIYQSGYRYYGQPIGASTDNDSRLLTVGGFHEVGSDNALSWRAQYASLNRDGVPGGNAVSPSRQQAAVFSARLERQLSERLTLGLNGAHVFNDLSPDSGLSKSSIQVSLTILN